MMKKNCLFLGYKKNKTSLISFLQKKNFLVKHYSHTPPLREFLKSDFTVSFGFCEIINDKILKKLQRPILNIHLSYLPFNRGAHPNFWSFIENTPSGFSIHEIDKGIDTGKIIVRKEVIFNTRLKKFNTFKKTYDYLFSQAEIFFKKNFDTIYNNNYKNIVDKRKGSFHRSKDLPDIVNNWNLNINLIKKKLR